MFAESAQVLDESSFDDCSAFYSLANSESGSERSWRSETWKSEATMSEKGARATPQSRNVKAATAGASILDTAAPPPPAAAAAAAPAAGACSAAAAAVLADSLSVGACTTGADCELQPYHSARTVASWTTGPGSEAGEILTVDDSEQPRSLAQYIAQQQQQQQQQQGESEGGLCLSGSRLSFERSLQELQDTLHDLGGHLPAISTAARPPPAAAAPAAAAPQPPPAAAAAVVGDREVMLNILPSALPFLTARALSKRPVRLVITADAVWGDVATFTPPAAAAVDGAAGKCASRKQPGCTGGLFSSKRSSRCD
jgi:hypothetical protein